MAELAAAQEQLNQGFQYDGSISIDGAVGGITGITPGTGSLAGTEYNAWAYIPGSGYVPVQVENGHTVQTGLPEGTIIYGDAGAWKITGGFGGEQGYTSEYIGDTPSNIWTPGKDTSFSGGGSSSGGGGGSGPSYSNEPPLESPPSYTNDPPLPGGSSSSTSGNRPGNSPSTAGNYSKRNSRKYASGTLSASGGLSLVGEEGPELRVLNSGDGIIPSDITKNLMDIGKYSARDLLNGSSSGTVVHIASLTLPGIKDSQEFIKYFNSSLWRKTLQYKTSG